MCLIIHFSVKKSSQVDKMYNMETACWCRILVSMEKSCHFVAPPSRNMWLCILVSLFLTSLEAAQSGLHANLAAGSSGLRRNWPVFPVPSFLVTVDEIGGDYPRNTLIRTFAGVAVKLNDGPKYNLPLKISPCCFFHCFHCFSLLSSIYQVHKKTGSLLETIIVKCSKGLIYYVQERLHIKPGKMEGGLWFGSSPQTGCLTSPREQEFPFRRAALTSLRSWSSSSTLA